MSLSSTTCLLFMSFQLATIISCQEVVRRTPTGFVGMRDKKYFGSGEIDHFYKRKPQFFVGVKGKRSNLEWDLYKRAMGFLGMRGKKYSDYKDYYSEPKRAPMGFLGVRGKKDPESTELNYVDSYEYIPKQASLIGQIDYSPNDNMLKEPLAFPVLNRLLDKYLQQLQDSDGIQTPPTLANETDPSISEQSQEVSNEIEKRAAHNNNFYGVRGKKSLQTKRPFDLSFRGKFIGVRGKKDLKNSGMNKVKFLLDNNGPWLKKKGEMSGFFGMRGKKWTEGSSLEMEYPN